MLYWVLPLLFAFSCTGVEVVNLNAVECIRAFDTGCDEGVICYSCYDNSDGSQFWSCDDGYVFPIDSGQVMVEHCFGNRF